MGGMLGLPEHHKDGVPWSLRKTGTRLSEEEVQELRDYMTPRSTTRSKAPGDKGKAPSGSSSPVSRPGPMQGPPDVLSLLQDPYMPNVGEYDPLRDGEGSPKPIIPLFEDPEMRAPAETVDTTTPSALEYLRRTQQRMPPPGFRPDEYDRANEFPWWLPPHRRIRGQ